jgi:hypothetical protein
VSAEHEAVERMAIRLWSTPDKSRGDGWTMHASDLTEDDWREVARTARREHPAVEALRAIVTLQDMDDWDLGDKRAHAVALNDARAVLMAIEEK